VRVRLDGELLTLALLPCCAHEALVARVKLLASLSLGVPHAAQDGRIPVRINGERTDVHVSLLPTVTGEMLTMRPHGSAHAPKHLEDLGVEAEVVSGLRTLLGRAQGLVLVAGPGGAGLSTTIRAVLRECIGDGAVVVSLEDPVEQPLRRVNQVRIRERAGVDFAAGIRLALRQSADVIAVGEIADGPTAELSCRAALDGRLVIGVIRADDGVAAAARLVQLGAPPYSIRTALAGAVAQRLVRVPCRLCAERRPIRQRERDLLQALAPAHDVPRRELRGTGCPACRQTGYDGWTALAELTVVDDELAALIGDGAEIRDLRHAATRGGTRPMRTVALEAVAEGLTTSTEVLRVLQCERVGDEVRCAHAAA
jgi:type II secretory ATPase GspE/PulE/Tfp pilus assembly ATPase PilB-like protein